MEQRHIVVLVESVPARLKFFCFYQEANLAGSYDDLNSADRAFNGDLYHQSDSRRIILFILSNWKIAGIFAGISLLIGVGIQYFVVPYQVKTQILVNDAQTSQLQAFTNNFFGLSKTGSPARKNQAPGARASEYLNRPENFHAFAKFVISIYEKATTNSAVALVSAPQMSIENDLGSFKALIASVYNVKVDSLPSAEYLNSNSKALAFVFQKWISISPSSPYEIQVSVNGSSKAMTYFVGMMYSKFAVDALKQTEEKEIEFVKEALEKQRDHFKNEFTRINREMVVFQAKPENALTLASGGNVANYLSDLMVRKNEIELKIADNNRTIEFLGGKKAAQLAAARDLGGRSQIHQIIEANNLLQKQAATLQDSINRFSKATSGSAEVIRMSEELKKTSDREFKNFQEANDMLSKLKVYQISVANKFELLRVPDSEEVKKSASVGLVSLIAIFFSQILFALFVFRYWVITWKRENEYRENMRSADEINIIALMSRTPPQAPK